MDGSTTPNAGWSGSSEDLAEVLRFAADAITVQGADGRVVYANDAAARQMGFDTAEEFLATPLSEVMHHYELLDESGAPLPLDRLPGRRALAGEAEPSAVVGFRVDGQGEPRWAVVHATPVVRGGTVAFVINAFQDITGIKRTEARLRLLADAGAVLADFIDYPSTLQALADLVVPSVADWCRVDVTEHGSPRRIAVSHPDPERRRMVEELQQRYARDAGGAAVSRVIETGEPLIITELTDEQLVAAAVDEEQLALLRGLNLRSVAILPLVARGEVIGALSLVGAESGHRYTDADLPFLQDLARRAAIAVDNSRLMYEAQEAVRVRDDFLAMASHDMRTPLQAILGNVQLARRRAERPGEANEELLRNLANAERTTVRLTRLVGELMDITMLRSGQRLPLSPHEVDLVAIAGEVVADHERTATRHRFRLEGLPALPGVWDPTRVERVVDNLVDNAVKYSPDGGTVTVQASRDGRWALLGVTDEGIGIPADEVDRIFEPYRRGSNALGLRGIGLGLAGAREVVRQLGGDIVVESVFGRGSTFAVRLPLDGPEAGPSDGPA